MEEKITKESHYEILYIISNKFTEEESKKINERVKNTISKQGGSVTYEEYWGKKKLAYPINHQNHGYYYLVEFDMNKDKAQAFDRDIKLDNDIVRHQVVSQVKRTFEEIQKEKAETKKIVDRKEPEEKKIEKKPVATKEESKIDLKDLDDKLDQILDSNDLL